MNNQDLLIIYDADCPMCNWYTGKFAEHGLLPEKGREAYQKIGPYTKTVINMDKARNHIALMDRTNGTITYGYDSLLEILGRKWAWIKKVGTLKIMRLFFTTLYDFISYNRKVIAPAKNGFLTCVPDRNITMRFWFIFLAMILVEYTAGIYFTAHFPGVTRFEALPFRESILFVSQIAFLFILARLLREKNIYDYLGHVALISALGGLILLVFQLAISGMELAGIHQPMIPAMGLGAVVMWMFIEHKKRVHNFGFHPALSWIWLAFRILLFFLIFKLY